MAERFSNNAVGTLASALDNVETTVALVSEAGAARFATLDVGDFQRATITNPATPEAFEIVRITANEGLSLTVERENEGTTAAAWPAGSKISARVTAGMLDALTSSGLQADDRYGGQFKTAGAGLVVNGRADSTNGVVQLGGYNLLQKYGAAATQAYGAGKFWQDKNMAHESVGGSPFVDLKDAAAYTWASNGYYTDGSIVAPPTPDGFLYLFQSLDWRATQTTTLPGFDGSGYPVDALGADNAVVGQWLPLPTPLAFTLGFTGVVGGIVLSEVGFICTDYGAGTAPVVSIGTDAAPTSLVNSVALSQIAGAGQVHRFPVNPAGEPLSAIKFTLNTPSDAMFYGRFYWRGFFLPQ